MYQEITCQQALAYADTYATVTFLVSIAVALWSHWRSVEDISPLNVFNLGIAVFHIAFPALGHFLQILPPGFAAHVWFLGSFLLIVFCEPVREVAFFFGKAMLGFLFLMALIHDFSDH